MQPNDVNDSNESFLWKQQYLPHKKVDSLNLKKSKKPFKFSVGDTVRVSYLKKKFSREYHQKWSDKIFRISKRFRREALPVYKITDFYGKQEIKGSFYRQEFQKVKISPSKLYKIDKILKTKTVKGKKLLYLGLDGQVNLIHMSVPMKSNV